MSSVDCRALGILRTHYVKEQKGMSANAVRRGEQLGSPP